ncbi:MAG: hypothetical protein H0T73_04345, partial [Ardenticatenales bacterium]|nr:hypothetical protein [Ardenticatenales bacterium]
MIVYDAFGNPIPLGPQVARGAHATLYEVQQKPGQVAKLYNSYRAEYEEKLRWMIANPPALSLPAGQMSLRWPQMLLYNNRARFVGFLMPSVERMVPLEEHLWRSRERLGVQHLLYPFAWTLATTVDALHVKGYVLGGALHPRNLFLSRPVNAASLTLLKADTFQVRVPHLVGHTLYPPSAQTEDRYLAPELLARPAPEAQTAEHDGFALAVL